MPSPPLPSTPLADQFTWMAAEARAQKEEAGMIVALFIEVFARLLSRLAGLAAGIGAGAPPQPAPRATPAFTAPVAAPVSPGVVPRVLGWLGGLVTVGGSVPPGAKSPGS